MPCEQYGTEFIKLREKYSCNEKKTYITDPDKVAKILASYFLNITKGEYLSNIFVTHQIVMQQNILDFNMIMNLKMTIQYKENIVFKVWKYSQGS